MLLNEQMRLSGLTSPPAPATLFDAERGDRKPARVWRKNKTLVIIRSWFPPLTMSPTWINTASAELFCTANSFTWLVS